MKAIILVGGEGTRLRPLTLHSLKSTVPMLGHAFLEYQFAFLRQHGIRDIVLSTCHKPELLRAAFGTGRRYGIKLHYAPESQPLGTAGAIQNAGKFIDRRETVVVLNGDILTNLNLTRMAAVHRGQRSILTIGLTWVEDPSAYGLVQTNKTGRVHRFLEKPSPGEGETHWINSGVYIFDSAVFDRIPEGVSYSSERQLFPELLLAGERVGSFPGRDYWMDIGTPAKYLQAHLDILEGRMFMLPIGSAAKKTPRLYMGKRCRFHPTVEASAPGVLGNDCVVGEEARIGEFSVLGSKVKVGPHAVIQHSVIWDGVDIGEGAKLSGCVICSACRIGRFVTVRPGSVLGQGSIIPDYSVV